MSCGRLQSKLIIRIARTKVDMPPVQPGEPTPTLVTECWVEGCCFEQRLLDPDATLVFRPLSVDCPVPGASDILVHISGFPTETTVYLKRLLKTVGGVLSEKLNRKTTHLVCAVPEGQKWTKAHEWGVTCVKDTWLWNMARTGVIDDVTKHLHGADMPNGIPLPTPSRLSASRANSEGEALGSSVPNLTVDEISGSSLSSRVLKSTPTHVDKPSGSSSALVADSTNALQSPKASTERLLNKAHTVPEPRSSPGHKGGVSPGIPSSTAGVLGTVSSPSALGSGRDVTAALRRLAEGPDAPTRSKVVSQSASVAPGKDSEMNTIKARGMQE